jgi:membrane-bound serine protease (ClpP class)
MFVAGVILLILEIFVIPGFGFTAILGIILVVASIFLSLFNTDFYFDFDRLLIAIVQVGAAFSASIVVMVLLFKYLPQSKTFHKFVLDTQSSSKEGFISNPVYDDLVNLHGESVTPLRPVGIVTLNGKRYDVVTEGEFIEKGKKVYVARVEGVKIIVKEVD